MTHITQEILRIEALHKSYGTKQILDNIHLSLSRGERAALVGENGAGKTTLARIITGHEAPDGGLVRLSDGAVLGFLPQDVTQDLATEEQITVAQYVVRATGDLERLRQELQTLEARMSEPLDETTLADVMARYGVLQEQFAQRGGYDLDVRMAQVFDGLGIAYLEREQLLYTLSGGERTRVALAALLLQEPDLLLLDEPTNHLDFDGIAWLEGYLVQYPHALLMITHDRAFIDRIVNQIIELSPVTHGLTIYHGDYADYVAERERQYTEAVSAYNQQMSEMAQLRRQIKQQTHNPGKVKPPSDPDKFIKFHKGQQADGTRSKKIRSAKQDLAQLEQNKLENPRHLWSIRYEFDPQPLISTEAIRLQHLAKAYADTLLFEGIDATVYRGQRVVLMAPNGTGKTTLLRVIAGLLQPDAGQVSVAPSAVLGYLDQDGETLNLIQPVLEALRDWMPTADDNALMALLHRCGLFADANLLNKRVGELSVGQRRKLGLARIIGARANVLLLDEPTNHLDLMSLEALESALLTFEGSILAVSHDRRFAERIATHIWHLQAGALKIERQPVVAGQ